MEFLEFTLWFVGIIWLATGIFRIFAPNWGLKKYVDGSFSMPKDNMTRLGGVFTVIWAIAIIFILLGYKIVA